MEEDRKGSRVMENLPEDLDLIIIGGGITGAGIFHEAVKMGLRALLVEQQDFAWGTSSRSSKLVHGGLRYLREGRIFLTRDAVKERERLLAEAPGLVEPLEFLVPVYRGRGPGRWTLEAGLSIYDLIARKRHHRFLSPGELMEKIPLVDQKDLTGGFIFFDAQVDDAGLVLRLINEAVESGGRALNYTLVESVNRNRGGDVTGVILRDTETGETSSVPAPLVINATGCWAESLHPSPKKDLHLRPLRGSHMIFPTRVLPIHQAVSFTHPSDGRPVFMVPWEGAVIVGTTDLDHDEDLSTEPVISGREVSYLMEGLHSIFPSLGISEDDCISTISGIRPVLSHGDRPPSDESREHVVWVDRGLVTITGGKLTTFRKLALDTLKAAKAFLPQVRVPGREEPGFSEKAKIPDGESPVSREIWHNLLGRYGRGAHEIVLNSRPEDLKIIPGTRTLWAELAYGARHESIRHLSDLMLRRVRIGLLLPHGGRSHLGRIQRLCTPYLPWDNRRWRREVELYVSQWHRAHSIPGREISRGGRFRAAMGRIRAGLGGLFQRAG
ncbi:MAG: glycerol-3-phosphate dehydrogenase/oxidase [Deltaproteobacteria bacterium]|nr:glycerol-3-phosphate dehydrogenase/oxidase [Deltaproteobacteria bacterium]